MNKKKQADFGDLTRGLTVLGEVRMAQAQAQALADVGMSEDEYRFMIHQVYKSLWDAEGASASPAPPANVALFRKYETEIKRYSMGGLEWVGM
jgi:hypothetical protein